MVVGLPMVRQLVLGFSVLSDHRNGKCNAFNYQEFWSSSLATAIANQALSAQAKTSSEETFTCGLLSGIGKLTLATLFPDKYAKVLSTAAGSSPDELLRLEQEQFDTDHNELAAALLKEWGFPVILIETVCHHEHPEKGDFQAGSGPIRWCIRYTCRVAWQTSASRTKVRAARCCRVCTYLALASASMLKR